MNADGSGQRLADACRGDFGQLAWSPNGQKIAFTSALTSGPNGNLEIYVVNADGSGQRRLTRSTVRDSDPVWSPDGRRIAFESNWQLWVMNADGSGQRRLTRNGDAQLQSCVVARRAEDRVRARQTATRSVQRVPRSVGLRGVRHERRRERSAEADARRIAASLVTGRAKDRVRQQRDGTADIYVMNADGSGQRNLTRGAGRRESQPVWSPAQK